MTPLTPREVSLCTSSTGIVMINNSIVPRAEFAALYALYRYTLQNADANVPKVARSIDASTQTIRDLFARLRDRGLTHDETLPKEERTSLLRKRWVCTPVAVAFLVTYHEMNK